MSTFFPVLSTNPIYNKVTATTQLSAGVITLYGVYTSTYSNPITATGEFIRIDVNGNSKYIKAFKN